MSVSTVLTFESHSTSVDNEAKVSSGHHDCALSGLGRAQAHELGQRYRDIELAAIYCSDLRRSWETAKIAFADRPVSIVYDERLRECDYGDHTRRPAAVVANEAPNRVHRPFPEGESYEEASHRVRAFLLDLADTHPGGHVMVIGHRATQYGLEHWLRGIDLPAAITTPWQWQPGWRYVMVKKALLLS